MVIHPAWAVSPTGYRWVLGRRLSNPREQPQLLLAPTTSWKEEVLSEAAPAGPLLFRMFADLKRDPDSVQEFANRYGQLSNEAEFQPVEQAGSENESVMRGCLLRQWQQQIADMARLTALWDLVQKADRKQLARYFQWREEEAERCSYWFDSHPDGSEEGSTSLGVVKVRRRIGLGQVSAALLSQFTAGDPLLAAWAYLIEDLNSHLKRFAAEDPIRIKWEATARRASLALAAPTLLSLVWLQLAEAIHNNRVFSRCRSCSTWFEVSPNVARAHRRFCSNACRTKAHRERQDRARQMFAEEMSFEEIAAKLDSDAATVRRWITGYRE